MVSRAPMCGVVVGWGIFIDVVGLLVSVMM